MSLSRQEAFDVLGVTRGSSDADIREAYKQLALKWHPDKHCNSDEATKKFQDISAAYKRLTSSDEFSEIIITQEDMFDLFAQMFFRPRLFRRHNFFDNSSDDDINDDSGDCDDYDSDIHVDDEYNSFYPFPPSSNSSKKSKPTVYSYTAHRPTASEASKNAEDLMKEEERLQKQKEKKKAKKKRQKENKRLEKERKEQEEKEHLKLKQRQENIKKATKPESSSESDREAEKENIIDSNKIDPVKASKNSSSKSKSSNFITNGKVSNSNHIDARGDKINGLKSTPTRKSKRDNRIIKSSDSESDHEETTGLDPASAFFARAAAAASKKNNSQPLSKPTKVEPVKKINGKKRAEDSESIEDVDPIILRSRQIAVKGNEMANRGHYTAAIELFSQAIQLNPRDFRFFGNRSFCYDRLEMYDNALKDAEKAISLAKSWPKGYFRKGRALSGLRLYLKAENAFEQVLNLDKSCDEAVEELRRVRGYRLMEMGFTRPQSEAAIRQYCTVQAALDVLLLQGPPSEISSQAFDDDVYLSDEEDYITDTIEQSKLDTGNPEGLRSLWVGNVQSTVSEKDLRDLFGPYGEVHSLRRLQEKFCCFVNFKKAGEASVAMAKLQGHELHGRFILIKFPDNPIVDGQPRTTILKKKLEQQAPPTPPHNSTQIPQQMMASALDNKMTGPVNGNECYFWRTTGCAFGDRCKYKHLSTSRGLDRQPWQKTVYKN